MSKKKHRSKRVHLNIGIVIFLLLLLYLVITFVIYVTRHKVDTYMVTYGTLTSNATYTALAIRSETVVDATTSGYFNAYASEGSRTMKDQVIANISEKENSKISVGNMTEEQLSEMRKLASEFSTGYRGYNYEDVSNFKYKIQSQMLIDGGSVGSGTMVRSAGDGVLCFSYDGYEDITVDEVTADDFNSKSYRSTRINTTDKVTAGEPLYKLITSDKWNLVFPISEEQYTNLKSRSVIKVKFAKDGESEKGDLKVYSRNGSYFAQVTLYSGMIRYATNRYLEIELVTTTESGLKIPVSSLVTKDFYVVPASYLTTGGEDGDSGFLRQETDENGNKTTSFVSAELYEVYDPEDEDGVIETGQELSDSAVYYVDTSTFHEGDILVKPDSDSTYRVKETDQLLGVYSTNRGYAIFRKVKVIDHNEEYALVQSGTSYGISQYDYIVRDAADVREDEIIF